MHEQEMRGKQNVILYVGDHDPSGLDMERSIRERFRDFSSFCEVPIMRRIALTEGQIEEQDLPPFWAKADDSRYEAYVREHGEECWEVDALPPDQLQSIAEQAILKYLDREKYEEVKEEEEVDIERFQKALEEQELV